MRSQLALVVQLVERLRPAFETFGYAIVSAGVFLESAALVGLIAPGDVILAVGGAYAAEGTLSLPIVLACAVCFAWLGETTGYLIGRWYGEALVRRTPVLRRFEDRLDRARDALRRNGGKAIVIGRFATGLGSTLPFAAGVSKVEPKTFLAFTLPTVAVWACAIVMLGYLAGDNLDRIDRILSAIGWGGFAVIVLALGAVWLMRKRRERRRSDVEPAPIPGSGLRGRPSRARVPHRSAGEGPMVEIQDDTNYTGVHAFLFVRDVAEAETPRELASRLRELGAPPEGPVIFASDMVGDYVAFAHVRTESLGELQELISGELWSRGARGRFSIEGAVYKEEHTDFHIGAKRSTPEVIGLVSIVVERGRVGEVLQALGSVPAFKGASAISGEFDILLQLGGDALDDVIGPAMDALQLIDGIVHTSSAFTDASASGAL
jgi:membrane-associated protein